MPEVPNLTNFSVQPNGASNANVSIQPPRSIGGEQLQEMGGALVKAGGVLSDIERDQQALANQVRVDDAVNKAKEAVNRLTFDPNEGFTNLKGVDALERPDGKSLKEEFGASYDESIANITAGLGNDAQRRAFSLAANGLRTDFTGNLDKYESDQFRDYTMSVREGTISLYQDQIGRDYADPGKMDKDLLGIRAAVVDQAKLLGKSAQWADAQAVNMESRAIGTAISSAMTNNDLSYAEGLVKTYGNRMHADDLLQVTAALTRQKDATYANDLATKAMTGEGGPSANGVPLTVEGMKPVFAAQESGGDYTVVNKSTGALGKYQLMPDTARNLAGQLRMTWKPELMSGPGANTPQGREYQEALGGAAIKDALAHSNGDPRRLFMYYYGGSDEKKWGKKTNKYADEMMSRAGYGPGAGATSSLYDKIKWLGEDPYLKAHPQALSMAEDRVRSLYSAQQEAITRAETEKTANIERTLIGNGGNFTPELQAQAPSKEFARLYGFSQELKAAQRRDDNDGDPILWGALKEKIARGEITSGDQLMPYAAKLSKNDYKNLASDIASIASGDTKKLDSMATLTHTLQFVHAEMLNAGVDWTPDNKDPAGAQRFGQFQSQLMRQIQIMETVRGKPLTIEEGRSVALQLLGEAGGTGGWLSSPKRGFELANPVLPLASYPTDVQQKVAGALRAQGYPVTEDNLRRVLAGGTPRRSGVGL